MSVEYKRSNDFDEVDYTKVGLGHLDLDTVKSLLNSMGVLISEGKIERLLKAKYQYGDDQGWEFLMRDLSRRKNSDFGVFLYLFERYRGKLALELLDEDYCMKLYNIRNEDVLGMIKLFPVEILQRIKRVEITASTFKIVHGSDSVFNFLGDFCKFFKDESALSLKAVKIVTSCLLDQACWCLQTPDLYMKAFEFSVETTVGSFLEALRNSDF